MTEQLALAGDVTSALTHFAAYGLMLLVSEECDGAQALVSFTEEATPQAVLSLDGCTAEDVAGAVRRVADRWARDGSWVQATMPYPAEKNGVAHRSPFSPRIQSFEDADTWARHISFRHEFVDDLNDDGLALRFISGLGEAAYWRKKSNSSGPDDGASRWEMKTRNNGGEFVAGRFAPLVAEVATWTSEHIHDGITGVQLHDVIGKGRPDSRTATGLTVPQPTDNALAFVALLGMGMMPPVRNIRGMSVTPGAYPRDRTHPRWMVLPVPVRPTTGDRVRSILLSVQFDQSAIASVGLESPADRTAGGAAWLRSRNIPALVVFPIFKGGSASAPERQVLNGKLVVL